MKHIAAIILAAGRGTRMNSGVQKTALLLKNKPITSYVLNVFKKMGLKKSNIFVVVGHKKSDVKKALGRKDCTYVVQNQQKGNAHATLQAKKQVEGKYKILLVVQGDDSFLYSKELLNSAMKFHRTNQATITALALKPDRGIPEYFWQLQLDKKNNVKKVYSGVKKGKKTFPTAGAYIFDNSWIWNQLELLKPHSSSGEIILPDLIQNALSQNKIVKAFQIEYKKDWLGINDKKELIAAEKIIK